MTVFMSQCDKKGIPKARPITCSICGFISKNESGHNSHKGMIHNRGNTDTQHTKEDLFKSEKYTAGDKPSRALYQVRLNKNRRVRFE